MSPSGITVDVSVKGVWAAHVAIWLASKLVRAGLSDSRYIRLLNWTADHAMRWRIGRGRWRKFESPMFKRELDQNAPDL